jgi:integrase
MKKRGKEKLWFKVPHRVGLYRNSRSGVYCAVKKLHGKRSEHSLRTTDRKIAERKMRDWVASLEKIDRELERTSLERLIEKFEAANRGKSPRTQATLRAILKHVRNWPGGVKTQIREIRTSDLEQWLALHERRLKNTSYNRYAGCLRQLFELAVKDKIISESPFTHVRTQWKKPQKPIRHVPTIDQFEAIVRSIRGQTYNRSAEESADFIEFLGLAGLGQAEAASLKISDVDWSKNKITLRRRKTSEVFHVPVYPHLRSFLQRRCQANGTIRSDGPLFTIRDAKKALTAACKRLGFPHFTQRNMRQCLIMRLWRAGIDKKKIAEWQGHQDGGQLILDTYTEVFGDDDFEYEQQQLAKLAEWESRRIEKLQSPDKISASVGV